MKSGQNLDNSISLYTFVCIQTRYFHYQKFWVWVIQKFSSIPIFPYAHFKKHIHKIISEIPSQWEVKGCIVSYNSSTSKDIFSSGYFFSNDPLCLLSHRLPQCNAFLSSCQLLYLTQWSHEYFSFLSFGFYEHLSPYPRSLTTFLICTNLFALQRLEFSLASWNMLSVLISICLSRLLASFVLPLSKVDQLLRKHL